MTLGEIIQEYYTSHGMSQRAFAKKCGLSNSYISILVNASNPSTGAPADLTIGSLNRIAVAMGTTIDNLIEKADDMPIRLSDKIVPYNEETDDEWAIRESLRENPELRILFDASKNATAEDLLEAAELIRARKTIRNITNRK